MTYYTKVLQPHETVRFVGSLHWTIYRNAILLGVLAIAVAVGSQFAPPNLQFMTLCGAGLVALWGLAAFLTAWFVRVTTEIVVTDLRIIHKRGWIARHTEEMNISKVETVDVYQGLWGRIFDFGTVLIRGIGGSWEPLSHVGAPLQLRNAIVVG